MNETLREKEELSRIESESLRKAKDEIASLRRKVDQHAEVMAEKDRTVQVSRLMFERCRLMYSHDMKRSCMTKLIRCSWSLDRLKSGIRTSPEIMRSFSNVGLMPNSQRSTG